MDRSMNTGNAPSLTRTALSATIHCLTGCSIGEILGMVLGATFHWDTMMTIVVSTVLAFIFGYSLTLLPLLRSGLGVGMAIGLAFASDTLSIAVMEVIDNVVMMVIPGAMDAHADTILFWGAMGLSLVLAGLAAFPLNRWMIARGRGHAVVHAHHGSGTKEHHAFRTDAEAAHHAHHHMTGNGGRS
jgi:hypothetical protein